MAPAAPPRPEGAWAKRSPWRSAGRSAGLACWCRPAILIGGGALLLRPVLPALRPLRAGALCIFAAVTLALAAGTLGLSSGASPGASGAWSSAHMQSHGGVAGEGLYQLAHRLVQDVGVDILVVFLLLAGLILLTGASLATLLRATGTGLIDTSRLVRGVGDRRQRRQPAPRRRGRACPSRCPRPSRHQSS